MCTSEEKLPNTNGKDDLEKLKANLSEIGKQLKSCGRIIVKLIRTEFEKVRDGFGADILEDEDEKTPTGSETPSSLNAHLGDIFCESEITEQGIAKEGASLRKAESGGDSSDIDDEIARIEQALARARAKEQCGDAGNTEAKPAGNPRPHTWNATRGKKETTALIIAASITALLTMALMSLIHSCGAQPPTSNSAPGSPHVENEETTELEPAPIRSVSLTIEVRENFLFSKYDIKTEVDETPLGTIQHGTKRTTELELSEGYHNLILYKPDDREVAGEMEIEVQKDTPIYLIASCSSTGISIEQLTPEEIDELYASELEKTADQPGVSATSVISQLEKLDYTDKGYTLHCYENGSELKDFNKSEFDVSEGSVDGSKRAIKLILMSNVPIEVGYPKETAQRVAVVAATNCYATDVFSDDGSSYDPGKFHSYADMSGYYLTVVHEGTWEPIDESTWHVEDLQLKAAGQEFYYVFSGDISQDGERYIVTTASITSANSLDEANDKSWSEGLDELKANENTPYLFVDTSLISDDRDTAAERAATEAETSARIEREEYEGWVDSQFSWFDGKNDQLVDIVKSRLNDERSFKHIDTNYIVCNDKETLNMVNNALLADGLPLANLKDIYIVMDFSAKNGFNATIKQQAHGIVRYPSGNTEIIAIL